MNCQDSRAECSVLEDTTPVTNMCCLSYKHKTVMFKIIHLTSNLEN